jgi:hypothetical protein
LRQAFARRRIEALAMELLRVPVAARTVAHSPDRSTYGYYRRGTGLRAIGCTTCRCPASCAEVVSIKGRPASFSGAGGSKSDGSASRRSGFALFGERKGGRNV